MASHGTIPLQDIWTALAACAEKRRCTWTKRERTHNWLVTFGDKSYPNLPRYDEIEVGHVKKMMRRLGILELAKEHIERLR